MSKLKVAIALGAGILGLTLLGDAKKASATPAPTPPLPPPPAPAPAKKPSGKAKKPSPPVTLTNEQAQSALDQAWPLLMTDRVGRDQLIPALRWAEQLGDTEREAQIRARLEKIGS
jgi:cell division septation protein DedD